MAEGDVTFFNIFKQDLGDGVHDMEADNLRMTLHTGYTPDIDAHHTWSDVSATEYGSGSGYTAGGRAVASSAWAVDDTNDRANWVAEPVEWDTLGPLSPVIPSHAIIWNDTPSTPEDPLICYLELGVTEPNGFDYVINLFGDIGRLS